MTGSGAGAEPPRARPGHVMADAYRFTEGTPDLEHLPAINSVVEAALLTWRLPERVKRLVLPSYRYTEADLAFLSFAIARDADDRIIAVAAWETAAPGDCPPGQTALLLHGLYVHPLYQHQGVGTRLMQRALRAARAVGANGLLVKAQRDAEPFFATRAFTRLDPADNTRAYERRYWHPA